MPLGIRRCSDVSFRFHIGRDVVDNAETSSRHHNWYVNETDKFVDVVTMYQLIPKYLSETDQPNTLQRHLNWCLNETDVSETL